MNKKEETKKKTKNNQQIEYEQLTLPIFDDISLSKKDLFLILVSLCDEVSDCVLVDKLNYSEGYVRNIAAEYKNDGYIKEISSNDMKGYYITKKGLLHAKEKFPHIISTTNILSTNRSDENRRKVRRTSTEIFATMYLCKFKIFRTDKPDLFYYHIESQTEVAKRLNAPLRSGYENATQKVSNTKLPKKIETPYYYTNKEIKNIGEVSTRFKSSAVKGIILSDFCFTVYWFSMDSERFRPTIENRLRAFLEISGGLFSERTDYRYTSKKIKMLCVFSIEKLEKLYYKTTLSTIRQIRKVYSNVIFIPDDQKGVSLIEFTVTEKKRRLVNELFLIDIKPKTHSVSDGTDIDGSPLFLLWILDFERLCICKEFAASGLAKKITICCFEFQRTIIKNFIGISKTKIEFVLYSLVDVENEIKLLGSG